jgi:hypothetical protein
MRYAQPQGGPLRLDLGNPIARDVVWLSGTNATAFGSSGHLRDVVTNRTAALSDNNNYFTKTPHKLGIISTRFIGSSDSGVTYTGPAALLDGAKEFTLVSTFIFRTGATSAQWLNFRVDFQHSMDVFSQTASTVTFGCDWAGAWNGSSNVTLSGLSDGDVVTICAVVNQAGARLFANGKLMGTKSGSGFTVSTASSTTAIVQSIRTDYVQGMMIRKALVDDAAISLTRNPWQVFASRPRLRKAAVGVHYTLAASTGSYSLTGVAAGLSASRRLSATTGSYALTGPAAQLRGHRRLLAQGASYALTAPAALLSVSRRLTAGLGAYVVSGPAANLRAHRRLTAAKGTYTFTGNSAGLLLSAAFVLTADVGSYSLGASTAALRVHRRMTAQPASYTVGAPAVALRAGRSLSAATAVYQLTGTPAALRAHHKLATSAAGYAVNSAPAPLRIHRRLAVGVGSLQVVGADVVLRLSTDQPVIEASTPGDLERALLKGVQDCNLGVPIDGIPNAPFERPANAPWARARAVFDQSQAASLSVVGLDEYTGSIDVEVFVPLYAGMAGILQLEQALYAFFRPGRVLSFNATSAMVRGTRRGRSSTQGGYYGRRLSILWDAKVDRVA